METKFDFSKPNLGLSEEEINKIGTCPAVIESALVESLTNNEEESFSFHDILKVIVNLQLSQDELSFTLATIIFNDIMQSYQNEILSKMGVYSNEETENEQN